MEVSYHGKAWVSDLCVEGANHYISECGLINKNTRVYVEEIGNFPNEAPVLKLMATLRSGAGVPVGFRATGNPGGPGHQWVKRRYIDPAPGGWTIIVDPLTSLKRIYIPSRVSDNSFLGADYVQRLQASGSRELVRAWLEGDWNAIEGAFFNEWSNKNLLDPFPIPGDWIRFRSGDWGSASPFSIGWWGVVQDDFDTNDGRVLPRGALVRYREWYGAEDPSKGAKGLKLTAEAVGDGIVKRERDDARLSYGVMDPSAFKEDGGPSIMERLNGRLLAADLAPFRPADNTRVASSGSRDRRGPMSGWDAMRARIKGTRAGPMLYCFHTCTASIRTIPVLQHDPARAEDLDSSAEDHCFTPDTLVDPLLFGRHLMYRRPRITKINEPIVAIVLSNGRIIRCTPDHWFLTASGWIKARNLGGKLLPNAECKAFWGSDFTKRAAATLRTAKGKTFIGSFGSIISELFRPGLRSTIATWTKPTTFHQILNASRDRNISGSTINHRPVELSNTRSSPALEPFLRLETRPASAKTAEPHSSVDELQKMFKSLAQSGALEGSAICVGVTPAGRSDVMCLTAPEYGMFSTGGIIASNCADEWRYACSSRPWRRFIPPPDPEKDAYRRPGDDMDDVASSVKMM